MERSEREKLAELFSIMAEQVGMAFERIDELTIEVRELHEHVDLLGLALDIDKADIAMLLERLDHSNA